MRIAVDAMGGDHAPRAAVEGAWLAAVEDDTPILLVGDARQIEAELARLGDPGGRLEVVHAAEAVGMDEPAVTPLRRKPDSSIRVCAQMVHDGRAQGMVSAGNTGAVMIAAKVVIGTNQGVDRPALAGVFPTLQGGRTVVLDIGANVTAKPTHLREFAVMGHFYAHALLGTRTPRVGLLSVGEEESKGTETTRQVHKVMRTAGLNFIGNVEGGDVFSGAADVVVCDGFVGNAILKSAEAMAELVSNMLLEELRRSRRSRLGWMLAQRAFEGLRRRTSYEEYGAVPLLGVEGGCFIAHGRSNARAIRSAVRRAVEFCAADLHDRIRDGVARLHDQEARLFGSSGSPTGREIVTS